MIGRLLGVVVLVLQLFLVCHSVAEEPHDWPAMDLPANQDGVLRAFERPDPKESEVAAKRVFSILFIAVSGLFIILILLAYFYEPKKGLAKPTRLRGATKDSYTNQHGSEPENTRWVIDE